MRILRSQILIAIVLVASGVLVGVYATNWYAHYQESLDAQHAVTHQDGRPKLIPAPNDWVTATKADISKDFTAPVPLNLPPPLPLSNVDSLPAISQAPPPIQEGPIVPVVNLQPPLPAITTTPEKAIRYLKGHDAVLDYTLSNVGPSGIGATQVWLTKDDGKTWSPFAENKSPDQGGRKISHESITLRDIKDEPFPDGAYGFTLVVKSRAGAGRTPKEGDAPQLRVVIDTKPPEVQLYKPMADPQNPRHVLIKWFAKDENLADKPVHLEYAEQANGPWSPLKLELENKAHASEAGVTGDYSFVSDLKTAVYLRIRVRDKAGNEGIAATKEAVWLDFTEPDGILTDIRAK